MTRLDTKTLDELKRFWTDMINNKKEEFENKKRQFFNQLKMASAPPLHNENDWSRFRHFLDLFVKLYENTVLYQK